MKPISILAALLAVLALTGTARANSVIGGETVVSPWAPTVDLLTGAGISVAPNANSEFAGGVFSFDITGGHLADDLTGNIQHFGEGVTLSSGANSLTLQSFEIFIPGPQGSIQGEAIVNGSSLGTVDIFNFDLGGLSAAQITNTSEPRLGLYLTSTAVGALNSTFSLNLDPHANIKFGHAATAPELASASMVPEPASWMLMILGFAGLALVRQRTKDVRSRRSHSLVA